MDFPRFFWGGRGGSELRGRAEFIGVVIERMMFRTAFLAKRMIITVLCRENYYVFILGLFAVIILYFNG